MRVGRCVGDGDGAGVVGRGVGSGDGARVGRGVGVGVGVDVDGANAGLAPDGEGGYAPRAQPAGTACRARKPRDQASGPASAALHS